MKKIIINREHFDHDNFTNNDDETNILSLSRFLFHRKFWKQNVTDLWSSWLKLKA